MSKYNLESIFDNGTKVTLLKDISGCEAIKWQKYLLKLGVFTEITKITDKNEKVTVSTTQDK